ncbi:MAG: methylated-DNA--[protein]-cysteine S-methyltransferase [Intrasporangium sp.]|uniref:methylated-DNA--[protein]-cysteine S-methyltransferase n=1 Tax=Intrasporangium sp. TaxID=1925024 RepID=UPI002647DFF9|nr:methylated-DNA--[protein]-cysteine S-methyltransferase [Intrasporangium sp.]MDN5797366.1 methylated-DNA--[protein]-cysteine S-methyltransferase [Intrasporangium sp.]
MPDTVLDPLTVPTPDDEQHLDRLHGQLVRGAAERDLVDLTYRVVDSPIGPLLLAATPAGLVRLAFESEGRDAVLESLATLIGPRVLHDPNGIAGMAEQLGEYFAGRRRAFEVPVDLRLAHGFRLDVLGQLRQIPYGATRSYAAVAASAGRPRAVRAVGSACAHNPVPLVVPCHRVVRSDGTPGGYLGGPEAKAFLLRLESTAA